MYKGLSLSRMRLDLTCRFNSIMDLILYILPCLSVIIDRNVLSSIFLKKKLFVVFTLDLRIFTFSDFEKHAPSH